MKILADENIPFVRDAFSELGDVHAMPGREMTRAAVADADILLVRSITRVGRDLLEGSRVQFVATATIGEDHIDKEWLASHGIGFASAPGSNAGSVMQYVTAALLALAGRFEFDLRGMTLGIIGVGNVGSRVYNAARALGMETLVNDPPLQRKQQAEGQAAYDFRPLDDILACNIVTLHVPLTREGADRTWHLADGAFLSRMRPGSILVNTSRGPVVHGEHLRGALDSGQLKASALDVWENEPSIDLGLVQRVAIATPHIAGYSFDGKVNGTRMIYEAACRHFGREPAWEPGPLLPPPEHPRIEVDGREPGALASTVRTVYDIMRDDAAMRGMTAVPAAERGRFFDRLRKEYPRRREFFNTTAAVRPHNDELQQRLAGLGFQIEV